LVTNSVKYAHPARVKGKIRLTCARVDGATRITLADDGVGLPDGFDPDTSGGMDLRMTRLLAKQLQARLSFRSSDLGLTSSCWCRTRPDRTRVRSPTGPA
jgi:two-component sensor histidine kinase